MWQTHPLSDSWHENCVCTSLCSPLTATSHIWHRRYSSMTVIRVPASTKSNSNLFTRGRQVILSLFWISDKPVSPHISLYGTTRSKMWSSHHLLHLILSKGILFSSCVVCWIHQLSPSSIHYFLFATQLVAALTVGKGGCWLIQWPFRKKFFFK